MKGFGKAIKRTPFAVTSRIGMSKKSNDPEFDEYHRIFTSLESAAEKLVKDTRAFIEAVNNLFISSSGVGTHFTELFQPIANEHDLIGKHPEASQTIRSVIKYEALMEELRGLIGPELELIDSRIVGPTKELQNVMKLIRKTIVKREHKLVDYDRFNSSLTKLRDKKEKSIGDEKNLFKLEQDFELATNEYEYINNALKVDLPRFMTLTTDFVDPLFNSLFYMQLNIYYLILEKMNSFVEDTKYDITNVSGSQIQHDYETKRTDAWERIDNFNIVQRIISISKLVQANRNQGTLSRNATTASTSSSSRVPPTGNPSFKKSPPPPPPSLSSQSAPPPYTPSHSYNGAAVAAAASKRAPPPPPPLKSKPKVPQPQYVIAVYDFAAQADGDLSFNAGDRIEIVERTASTEDWWTGRLNGVKGVFPGNYVQDA